MCVSECVCESEYVCLCLCVSECLCLNVCVTAGLVQQEMISENERESMLD